ncbi:MAG TPA: hypothetical protein VLD17_13265 [Gemmatimonadaceae bacterium]|nr:hypothetical protein [Gemmatimonadaceae bacterium]
MADLFDTSSIPDEPSYWDALASRIANAAPRRSSVVAWVGSRQRGWVFAAYLAAAAAVAIAAAMAIEPPRRASTAAMLAAVLTPNDALGRMLAGTTPPSLTALPPVQGPSTRSAQ